MPPRRPREVRAGPGSAPTPTIVGTRRPRDHLLPGGVRPRADPAEMAALTRAVSASRAAAGNRAQHRAGGGRIRGEAGSGAPGSDSALDAAAVEPGDLLAEEEPEPAPPPVAGRGVADARELPEERPPLFRGDPGPSFQTSTRSPASSRLAHRGAPGPLLRAVLSPRWTAGLRPGSGAGSGSASRPRPGGQSTSSSMPRERSSVRLSDTAGSTTSRARVDRPRGGPRARPARRATDPGHVPGCMSCISRSWRWMRVSIGAAPAAPGSP